MTGGCNSNNGAVFGIAIASTTTQGVFHTNNGSFGGFSIGGCNWYWTAIGY